MPNVFDAWANSVSSDELEEIEKKAEESASNDYPEIPDGTYLVSVEKMELKETPWKTVSISIDFKILEGEFKNSHLFFNGNTGKSFSNGLIPTAKLISAIVDFNLAYEKIGAILQHDAKEVNEFLLDCLEASNGKMVYELNYKVKTSTKINEYTNKPYVNRFFTILEDGIYDA